MLYTAIPNTALTPSALCMGSNMMGSVTDKQTSFRLLDAFVAAGGTFLDTAKVYADWLPGERSVSEKTIGEWLRHSGKRSQVVVATKGAHPELATMHIGRLSPAEIVADLDASLRHLQTDVIDLYWLHRDDVKRPVAEILETMESQVRAGKIRYYGCSNWRAGRIGEAQAYARSQGWTGFVADQMMWSLAAVDYAALPDKTMVAMDADLKAVSLSERSDGYSLFGAGQRLFPAPGSRREGQDQGRPTADLREPQQRPAPGAHPAARRRNGAFDYCDRVGLPDVAAVPNAAALWLPHDGATGGQLAGCRRDPDTGTGCVPGE